MAVLQLGKQFLVENESNSIKIVNSESKSIRRRDDDVGLRSREINFWKKKKKKILRTITINLISLWFSIVHNIKV
jgi:hypothetical protein